MKTLLQKLVSIVIFASIYFTTQQLHAQCGAGFTNAQINFDMHYFETTSMPTSPLNFAIGKNKMRFAWTGTNTLNGTVATHSGQGGSFGAGNDMQYTVGNGADTLVFDKEVSNLRFSVYDIDKSQRMVVTARNAAGTSINITTLARVSGSTLTILGSGSTSASATASSTAVANNATNATANVTIAGPVKTVILTFTKATGTDPVFISDITACNNNTTTGVFPTNYQAISTPEAGQPHYTVASYGDSIVAVDMVNNTVQLLYEVGNTNLIDTLFPPAINSLAYDPYNQVVYFADNARARRNLSLFKYDVKTGVKSTWVADIRTLGIQIFGNGMGSGGASFYDGALYIGQDMTNTSGTTEPATVYRIDIDTITGNALSATRVWSKRGYDGTNSVYDWADFVINDGVFYNFNSAASRAANTGIEHISLTTNTVTNGYSLGSTIINGSQSGIAYNGTIYHFHDSAYQAYNNAGGFAARVTYSGAGTRSLTDNAESFKYPYDYGDAPTSYGITYHLFRTSPNLTIGNAIDYEVANSSNALADADDAKNTGASNDEDGVSTFPVLTTSNTSYTVNVRTRNSTGAAATLYGYIDFNRDGDFADAGERSNPSNVPNGTTTATPIAVNWTGLSGGSVGSSFIRFRLASNSTEASNRNGYAASGEVEDYPFPISASSLPVELINFTATANENYTTTLEWSTASEINNEYFEIQRRNSDNTWENLGRVTGHGFSSQLNNYNFVDKSPNIGINYYQLKQVDFDGKSEISPMVSVTFENKKDDVTKKDDVKVYPNPTSNDIYIQSAAAVDTENEINVLVFNVSGEVIQSHKMQESPFRIDLSLCQSGMYFIKAGNQTYRILKQ